MIQLTKSTDTRNCVSEKDSKNMVDLEKVYEIISKTVEPRSAWDRGVRETALDILDPVKEYSPNVEISKLRDVCLNGASNWSQYSLGGCLLINDEDIAERFCSPSIIKKLTNARGDLRRPNGREEWLDVQTRGASQAFCLILRTAKRLAH